MGGLRPGETSVMIDTLDLMGGLRPGETSVMIDTLDVDGWSETR